MRMQTKKCRCNSVRTKRNWLERHASRSRAKTLRSYASGYERQPDCLLAVRKALNGPHRVALTSDKTRACSADQRSIFERGDGLGGARYGAQRTRSTGTRRSEVWRQMLRTRW